MLSDRDPVHAAAGGRDLDDASDGKCHEVDGLVLDDVAGSVLRPDVSEAHCIPIFSCHSRMSMTYFYNSIQSYICQCQCQCQCLSDITN